MLENTSHTRQQTTSKENKKNDRTKRKKKLKRKRLKKQNSKYKSKQNKNPSFIFTEQNSNFLFGHIHTCTSTVCIYLSWNLLLIYIRRHRLEMGILCVLIPSISNSCQQKHMQTIELWEPFGVYVII